MKSLPIKAQYFLYAIYFLGAVALFVIARGFSLGYMEKKWWELLLFVGFGLGAAGKHFELVRFSNEKNSGSISIVFLVTFVALLRLGPQAAVLVGFTATLLSCFHPIRLNWMQTCFNLSNNLIQTLASSMILVALNHDSIIVHFPKSIPALVVSCLTYFLINTGTVATIIALTSEQKIIKVWRDSFLWTSPSYFIGAIYSALGVYILKENTVVLLVSGIPIALLTYYAYQKYSSAASNLQQQRELLEQKSADLEQSKEQLAQLYVATVRSLATAIDARDQVMHQHILRVQKYACAIAKEMGFTGNDLMAIETSALLHDIGKMGVPDYVLHKPGRLTKEEFEMMKEHPRIGADILDPVVFPWPVVPGVKYHHEHWDGTGYPEGKKGEDIPLQGRILAVADVYDALTSPRAYRNAWHHEKAMAQIIADAGSHFDPMVVDAFVKIAEEVRHEVEASGLLENTGAVSVPSNADVPQITTPRAANAARNIRRASSELWALYEVAQTLSTSLGVDDTLQILGRKLEEILPGTTCLFLISDDKEDLNLRVRVAVGANKEFLENCRTSGVDSLSMKVADEQKTYNGIYDPQDLLIQASQTSAWIELKSALIVPLVYENRFLGTMNIYRKEENAFPIHEQNLLERIGERTAMALSNGLLYDRTRSRASTDPLTGLANIRYMADFVEERCQGSKSEDDRFALLCIDLDSFKPINDNFGHQKGDQVLRDLAGIFQSIAGKQNTVARYGGDEFLIMLENADLDVAREIADQIEEAVRNYDPGLVHHRLGVLKVSASIGVASYPEDGQDWSALLSVADSTMYIQKNERKLRRLASNTTFSTGRTYERSFALHSETKNSDTTNTGIEHLPFPNAKGVDLTLSNGMDATPARIPSLLPLNDVAPTESETTCLAA